ncbi:ATP-dependent Clp protease ATP-binding subunit ClpC-like protein [Cladobotryum mycophilum]|uniref:ATP-dependent Clp protease ATP-binding subunit ClpC-like protein n=1 Tax=Cladobotryum mycophilum TaxID=491253 RepID=A0ABR0S927_9HYPO
MSSNESHDELVRTLMRECNCTEERAITLLKNYNNDVDRAKRHHQLLQLYAQDPQSTSSTPSTPVEATSRNDQSLGSRSSSPASSLKSLRPDTPSPSDESGSSGSPKPNNEPSDDVPPVNTTDPSDDTSAAVEWDFTLPILPLPLVISEDDEFGADVLAGAIQHGTTIHQIRSYLALYDARPVRQLINNDVMENDEYMVRLLIEFGADVNAVHAPSQVPLLAFAMVCGETLQANTTTMVCTLLSSGASPLCIPEDLFKPYMRIPLVGPQQKDEEEVEVVELTAWCSHPTKVRLAKAINLSQRYFLEKAVKLKAPSVKRRQIARHKKAQGLLGVPYFLVGQSIASEMLIQRLLTHLMMPTKQPLVLCFAGPSGHGKTELARQLGHLLSLDLEVVDCTVVNREMELFGPRPPYSGYEGGSAVNNFLATHSGKRCIVFLDEFEKTTKEIHQSLLLPFDNGEYQDRRNGEKINCSNTIWILATNALDNTILEFYDKNSAMAGDDDTEKSRLVKKLSQRLQEEFLQTFDAPVTGRISDLIPFLPFSAGEQAVITHKYLLELARDLRRPVNLSAGPEEQLVGNIRLLIRKDAAICSMLAQGHYHQKLGARSLKSGVQKVKRIVLDAYLDDDEEIREGDELCDFVLDVEGDEIVTGILGSR